MTTAWVRRSAQEEGPGGAAQKGLSRKEAPDLAPRPGASGSRLRDTLRGRGKGTRQRREAGKERLGTEKEDKLKDRREESGAFPV